MYKKIQVYLKIKNNYYYLWSTNSYRTCKEAKSNAIEWLKVPHYRRGFEKQYKIIIDDNAHIIARFDKGL